LKFQDITKKDLKDYIRLLHADLGHLSTMKMVYTHKREIEHVRECREKIKRREEILRRARLTLKVMNKSKPEKVIFT